MTSHVTVEAQPRRGLVALIVVLGIGLGSAIFLLWQQNGDVRSNRTRIGQLEQDNTDAGALISTLQKQVRTLCGARPRCAPATAAPRPSATATSRPPAPVVIVVQPTRAAGTPTPGPRASAAPQPSASPTPRATPTATPTPTSCPVTAGPIRICPGGNP